MPLSDTLCAQYFPVPHQKLRSRQSQSLKPFLRRDGQPSRLRRADVGSSDRQLRQFPSRSRWRAGAIGRGRLPEAEAQGKRAQGLLPVSKSKSEVSTLPAFCGAAWRGVAWRPRDESSPTGKSKVADDYIDAIYRVHVRRVETASTRSCVLTILRINDKMSKLAIRS